jgi:hypothetical protein
MHLHIVFVIIDNLSKCNKKARPWLTGTGQIHLCVVSLLLCVNSYFLRLIFLSITHWL